MCSIARSVAITRSERILAGYPCLQIAGLDALEAESDAMKRDKAKH
jgi:hypothetical protein